MWLGFQICFLGVEEACYAPHSMLGGMDAATTNSAQRCQVGELGTPVPPVPHCSGQLGVEREQGLRNCWAFATGVPTLEKT